MKTDQEVLDTHDDLEMLKRPRLWSGDFLCLKKDSNEFGFMDRSCWTVYLGYIFDGGNGEVKEYNSPEAIIADGWIVD